MVERSVGTGSADPAGPGLAGLAAPTAVASALLAGRQCRGDQADRGEDEPEAWTINAEVPNVHTQGSPGIYGFSPQSRHRVYVDNVKVTPNK